MTDEWNGNGTLNNNLEEVHMFSAYMKELSLMKPLVDFFFDKVSEWC